MNNLMCHENSISLYWSYYLNMNADEKTKISNKTIAFYISTKMDVSLHRLIYWLYRNKNNFKEKLRFYYNSLQLYKHNKRNAWIYMLSWKYIIKQWRAYKRCSQFKKSKYTSHCSITLFQFSRMKLRNSFFLLLIYIIKCSCLILYVSTR